MKYGVFSDVHGNYQALKAVLEFYRKNGVEDFICCGDIVGYGPQPQECAETLSGLKNLAIVMGNHDAALSNFKPWIERHGHTGGSVGQTLG